MYENLICNIKLLFNYAIMDYYHNHTVGIDLHQQIMICNIFL